MSAYYNYNNYIVCEYHTDNQRGFFCPECDKLHGKILKEMEEFKCDCGYYLMKDEEYLRTSRYKLDTKGLYEINKNQAEQIIKLKDTLKSVEYNLNTALNFIVNSPLIEDKELLSISKRYIDFCLKLISLG